MNDKQHPLERTVRRHVREHLKRYGPRIVVLSIPGGARQQAGTADLLLCVRGRFVAMELKAEGRQPTPAQRGFLLRVTRAGGIAGVVRSIADAEALMRQAELTSGGPGC